MIDIIKAEQNDDIKPCNSFTLKSTKIVEIAVIKSIVYKIKFIVIGTEKNLYIANKKLMTRPKERQRINLSFVLSLKFSFFTNKVCKNIKDMNVKKKRNTFKK